MIPRFGALLVCLVCSTLSYGQEPGIALRIDNRTLEPGEVVEVRLVCTNTGVPEPPTGQASDGLKLEALSPTPDTSRSISIIGGRRTERMTYTFRLRLTAVKEGTHTVGPLMVSADGTTYQSNTIPIVVKPSENSSQQRGNSFVFVDMRATPRSVYITESYEAVLRIGIRSFNDGTGRGQSYDMLNAIDQRRSQFSVFAGGKVARSRIRLPDSTGVSHNYEIFEIKQQVVADEPGNVMVGPVFVRVDYPTSLRRGFFGYEVGRTRKETATAPALALEVRSPPTLGRPAAYTGSIGRFSLEATAKPSRVERGQPVTLTLSITGDPLTGLAGPDLSRQPELQSRFDFTVDELVGDVEAGAKVYRKAIFPKQEGEQSIPPITWSYFDPREERYVSLTTEPISLVVDPSSAGSSTLSPLDDPMRDPSRGGLTRIIGGLSPNYVDPVAVLASQDLSFGPGWLAAMIGAPLAWAMISLGTTRRARLRDDPSYARRRRARGNAYKLLRSVVGQLAGPEGLQDIAEAIRGFVCDRFNLPPGHLTPGEARSVLIEYGASADLVDQVASFLESSEAVRFASVDTGQTSLADTAARARAWILQIEKNTR